MNKKEDILERSRQENIKLDEREQLLKLKAIKISRFVGIVLCFLIVIIEGILLETSAIGFACLTIYYSMVTVENWITVAMIKKKDDITTAVINTIFLIAVLILFLFRVFN